MTSLVLALAGTDHHPFNRLVEWVDAAALRRPDAHFVVQYGASRPPQVAEGLSFLSHPRLIELLGQASAVVCHGGPGVILEARDAGHVPLCVPRDPALGEHVDGHQQRFAALVGGQGMILTIDSLVNLHAELDCMLAHRLLSAATTGTAVRASARAQAGAMLDELVATRPHRRAWLHRV